MPMSSNFFIANYGVGGGVDCFLVVVFPVWILRNLQLPWKFIVGPRNISPRNVSSMVLVGGTYLWVYVYVPNSG